MAQEVEVRPLRYNTVAASVTAQKLVGAVDASVRGTGGGSIDDILESLLIIPGTAAAGTVTILDGSTSISVFAGGGTTALPTLAPFLVPIGARSQNGAWAVTTGANVTVIACGRFT